MTDKIILVTGGAGYIGSQLIRDLVADPQFSDTTIRIYDNMQRHHFCGLMDLPPEGRFEFIDGDVLDRINLGRAMAGVETVIHLAAIVSTPFSFDHPEWTEQINHWGTASVVETAINAGVSRFLFTSSASVYGPGGPFRETDTCRPIGPYAISKHRAEEEIRQSCGRGLKCTILRLGTTFGNAPAMRFDAVAGRLAYLAGTKRPMVVHGSGSQVRPLIHIQDASAAIRLCLAKAQAEGEIINAVTLNPTANEIAKTLQTLVPDATIRYTDQNVLTEISYVVDSTKLMDMGFKAQFDLESGLNEMLSRWTGYQSMETKLPRGIR